jgi:hypothetical protein
MFRLFHRLEESVDPSILTVRALSFVILWGCTLKVSLEYVCIPFVSRNVSTLINILEFYCLDEK